MKNCVFHLPSSFHGGFRLIHDNFWAVDALPQGLHRGNGNAVSFQEGSRHTVTRRKGP